MGIFEILDNGLDEQGGKFTEAVTGGIFEQLGWKQPDGKFNGDNGFDHILFDEDANGSVIAHLIGDSKQVNMTNGRIQVKKFNGDGNQMAYYQLEDDWINDVIRRMSTDEDPSIIELADKIDANRVSSEIDSGKFILGVDRYDNAQNPARLSLIIIPIK